VADITADELYGFILANAEEIDGVLICRVSLIEELRARGIDRSQQVRVALVKELERRGLVRRPHPRSRSLILTEPSGGRFHADVARTQQRIARLREYMSGEVLRGKDFVCASWSDCESSIPAGCTFTEGQLSHVGKHFDLTKEGKPYRVVVVGQEVGGSGRRVTLEERYERVHDASGLTQRFEGYRTHKRRNPHMRGTTLALREIFGGPGTDHETEFLDVDGQSVHLFDCFALVNRLLCASHVAATSNGKPTKTMLANCERHFAATMKILQPTLVVVQGVTVWRRSQRVLRPRQRLSDHFVECDLAGRLVLVGTFTHPSARAQHRWDSPTSAYFLNVVRPTLRSAVERL
jgi:hypothetical protein